MNQLYKKIENKLPTYSMLFFSIILYAVFLLSSQDNDMYFEVVSGQDILKGNFETASHVFNMPIVVQQWLYSACMALFNTFGFTGQMLFVFIQNVILVFVSAIYIYTKTNDKKRSIISAFVALLYCSEYMINIRPQTITMILLLLELLVLDNYINHNRKIKYLLPLIPILILAANFHQAIFLYHIMILAPYYFYDIIFPKSVADVMNNKDNIGRIRIDWKLALCTPILVSCSLCTPYGLNGSLYIVKTFMSNAYKLYNINELKGISILSFFGIKIFALVAIAILLIYKKQTNIFINFYIFGIVGLSIINIRHISILYLAVTVLLCSVDVTKVKSKIAINGITCFIALLCMCLASNVKNLDDSFGNIANVIEEKDAKIYNTAVDAGGYLEYNGYTNVRFDSRFEAFAEEQCHIEDLQYDEYMVSSGYTVNKKLEVGLATDEQILEVIDDYDYVLARSLDYVNRITIKSPEWQKIYTDKNYVIWKHLY